MRQFKAAALVLLLLGLPGCAARSGDFPELAQGNPAAAPVDLAATPYYVEFHSRPSIISGHTYLVYGALDERGYPKEQIVTGFFPEGRIFGLFAGMIAMPGRIDKSYMDQKLPDMNVYRRNITAEQYGRLNAFVDREKGKTKVWNMFVNNCNDFAADAARAIGLNVPSGRFMPPALFIMTLSDMNA